MDGTAPVPVLEDLAGDPNLRGRLMIGVARELFFSGYEHMRGVLPYFRR